MSQSFFQKQLLRAKEFVLDVVDATDFQIQRAVEDPREALLFYARANNFRRVKRILTAHGTAVLAERRNRRLNATDSAESYSIFDFRGLLPPEIANSLQDYVDSATRLSIPKEMTVIEELLLSYWKQRDMTETLDYLYTLQTDNFFQIHSKLFSALTLRNANALRWIFQKVSKCSPSTKLQVFRQFFAADTTFQPSLQYPRFELLAENAADSLDAFIRHLDAEFVVFYAQHLMNTTANMSVASRPQQPELQQLLLKLLFGTEAAFAPIDYCQEFVNPAEVFSVDLLQSEKLTEEMQRRYAAHVNWIHAVQQLLQANVGPQEILENYFQNLTIRKSIFAGLLRSANDLQRFQQQQTATASRDKKRARL